MSAADDSNSSVSCETEGTCKTGKVMIDELSKEELLKQVKKQLFLLQKTKNKCDVLTKRCTELEENNNHLKAFSPKEGFSREDGNSKEELKSKIQSLWNQFVFSENNENVNLPLCHLLDEIQKEVLCKLSEKESQICGLQEGLKVISEEKNITSKSLREAEEQIQCMQLKLDTLTMTCQCLQEDARISHEHNKELKNEINVLTAARDTALESLSILKEKFSRENNYEIQNLTMDILKLKQSEEKLMASLDEGKIINLSQQEELKFLIQEKNELKDRNVVLSSSLKSVSEENVNLKLCIEEYENEKTKMTFDIEKLHALREEFTDLNDKFHRINVENNSLKEELQGKCFALDEFNYQIEMLISSMKLGAKQKNVSGGFKTDKEPLQNVYVLSSLYDEISSQLKNQMSHTSSLQTELENMTLEKQMICDELNQVKDLNQFLEDEVKSLMEENEQLKSVLRTSEANMENDALHISKLEAELQEALDRERIYSKKFEKDALESKDAEEETPHSTNGEDTYIDALKPLESNISPIFTDLPDDDGSTKKTVAVKSYDQTCDISNLIHSSESFFSQDNGVCVNSPTVMEELSNSESIPTQQISNDFSFSNETVIYTYPKEIPDCNKLDKDNVLNQSNDMYNVQHAKIIQSLQIKLSKVESNLVNLTDKYVALQKENKCLLSENEILKERFKSAFNIHDENGNDDQAEIVEFIEAKRSLKKTSQHPSGCFDTIKEESIHLDNENQGLKEEFVPNKHEESALVIQSLKEKSFETETSLKDLSDKCVLLQDENELMHSEKGEIKKEYKNMCQACHNLKQTLDNKSLLLEGIHVQMDSLLSKIEDLNEEIKDKECVLKAMQEANSHLKFTVKQLNNVSVKKQCLISSVYDLVNILREQKRKLLEEISVYKKDWCEVFQGTSSAINNISKQYNKCHVSLNEHQKIIREREAEILNLRDFFLKLENEVAVILRAFRTSLDEKGIKLGSLEESFTLFSDEETCLPFSTENDTSGINQLEAGQVLGKSFGNFPVITEQHSRLLAQRITNKIENILNVLTKRIFESTKTSDELSNFKTSVVPNLEKIISDLKTKLNDQELPLKQDECKAHSSMEGDNISKVNNNEVLLKKQLSEMDVKMNKLKAVAVKAKRELAETKKMLEQTLYEKDDCKQQVDKIAQELDRVSSVSRQYSHNFQSLQAAYDELQDDYEELKSKVQKLEEGLSASLKELKESKEKNFDLEKELDKSRNSLNVSIAEKEVIEKQVVELGGKIIILESRDSDKQRKVESLMFDLLNYQKELKDITEEHKAVKQQLNEALKEGKKPSLLDLEMADYERSISKLNDQLHKKCIELEELQADMDNLVAKNNSLQEEMNHIENQRETEEKRAANLKDILEKTKSELAVVKNQRIELRNSVVILESQLEILTLQGEDYRLQLSQAAVEIETLNESLKSSSENHQRIVHSLDSKVNTLQQECDMARKDIENANQEFENYKIRVHSVLKQQRPAATSFIPTEDESKEKLKKLNEKFKLQIVDMGEKLKIMTLENESLQEEHDHLLQRHSKLVEDLDTMNRNWSERLEKIIVEKNQLQTTQEELTLQHSSQTSMLTTTFTKQIKDLQEKHKFEIESFQKQLESSDMEIARLHVELCKTPSVVTNCVQDETIPFDICLQERQEGEGSECTDEQTTPIRHLSLATIPTTGFLPLEKLLQSSIEPETPKSYISNTDSERFDIDLSSSYRKFDHLSELLNESEANNFRLIEQVRVLKEEVRRLERNKEREEHAENLEYLKNIFVKFLTLQTGDEKSRLIPVLTTMLKLSPLEQKQLQAAAGELAEPSSSSGGWGNYIPRWSGLM